MRNKNEVGWCDTRGETKGEQEGKKTTSGREEEQGGEGPDDLNKAAREEKTRENGKTRKLRNKGEKGWVATWQRCWACQRAKPGEVTRKSQNKNKTKKNEDTSGRTSWTSDNNKTVSDWGRK